MYSQMYFGETITVNLIQIEELTTNFIPESGGMRFMMAELRKEEPIVGLYKAEIEIWFCGICFLNFLSKYSIPCHYLPYCLSRNDSSETVAPEESYAQT
jgi:hypothetical protein